jgi:hypothetical protein
MENNINWLKLDDLLDKADYIATDKEVKQAFRNRGFIEIKKTKFVNSNDHDNILVERPGNVKAIHFDILGWHYVGRTELNENGTQTHFYTKNDSSNEPPKQHFIIEILKKFKRKPNQ